MKIRIVGLENKWWPFWYGMTPDRGGIYHGSPRKKKIIVSLTSFPVRIDQVHLCIESLLRQTVRPDCILLYLSKEQFPGQKIPEALRKLERKGLEVKFEEGDLRPHKKYYYAMQEYPEDIIITTDDDCYYQRDLIEKLMESYQKFPNAISCMRAHEIAFKDGKVAAYQQWGEEVREVGQPSMMLMPTGCGGVLYPPHCLAEEVFRADKIQELCLSADDIWLRAMGIVKGTPVVKARSNRKGSFTPIRSMREEALMQQNVSGGGNDEAINKVFFHYGIERILQNYVI